MARRRLNVCAYVKEWSTELETWHKYKDPHDIIDHNKIYKVTIRLTSFSLFGCILSDGAPGEEAWSPVSLQAVPTASATTCRAIAAVFRSTTHNRRSQHSQNGNAVQHRVESL